MELLIHLLSKSHRESFRLANLPYSNGTGTSAAKGIKQMLNTCLLLEKLLSFISLTSHYIGTSAPKMVTSLCPSSSVWFIMWTIPPHSIFLSGNACFYGGVISLVGTLQVQPSLSPLRCALPLHGLVSSSIIDTI